MVPGWENGYLAVMLRCPLWRGVLTPDPSLRGER